MLFNFRLFAKVFYAISLLALIILVGTVGFTLIEEDYSLFDAFYMTIITISTAGFQEVGPNGLSNAGRLFTAFLIITSFGTFAYAVSAITSYLVGGEYRRYFKQYRLKKILDNIESHVIVCGLGRVGKQATYELGVHGNQFVVIEEDEDVVDKHRTEFPDYTFMEADATVDDTLIAAGIMKASALITTLPKDADNLFVVLSARELNPNLKIISRASSSTSIKKLRRAGADNVIMPDKVGGSHMASLVTTPDVMEFLDSIRIEGLNDVNLEEVSFSELPADFKYKTIEELNARKITGCNIIGFRTAEGEYLINPAPDTAVIPNSKLFVLGTPDQIQKLNSILGIA